MFLKSLTIQRERVNNFWKKKGFTPSNTAKGNLTGFTLIELLVVISIIGFLATASMVMFNNVRMKARDARRVADFKQVQTALEMFYDQTIKYPISLGGATWDHHWYYFSTCLEAGNNCGFTVSNYNSVMKKVPQDPLDNPATYSDSDPTYYTGWEGRTTENYILKVQLETNHPALQTDADGGWRNASDGGCDDNNRWYCIKKNWPW